MSIEEQQIDPRAFSPNLFRRRLETMATSDILAKVRESKIDDRHLWNEHSRLVYIECQRELYRRGYFSGDREMPTYYEEKDSVIKAFEDLLRYTESRECTHEETYRGGAIWTICSGCGRKWADGAGGFQPYTEPYAITNAREALALLKGGKR